MKRRCNITCKVAHKGCPITEQCQKTEYYDQGLAGRAHTQMLSHAECTGKKK